MDEAHIFVFYICIAQMLKNKSNHIVWPKSENSLEYGYS